MARSYALHPNIFENAFYNFETRSKNNLYSSNKKAAHVSMDREKN